MIQILETHPSKHNNKIEIVGKFYLFQSVLTTMLFPRLYDTVDTKLGKCEGNLYKLKEDIDAFLFQVCLFLAFNLHIFRFTRSPSR